MTVRLERVALPDVDIAALDSLPDRTVFQTREWLDFLAESQHAEPVVAKVIDGTSPLGWFTGALVSYSGLRVLGSPLRGWTTSYMGFNLDDPGAGRSALTALRDFAFGELRCVHLEVMDRCSRFEPMPSGFTASALPGYELDLRRDDDALLAAMTANGRRDVRRAIRNGITVEAVDPTNSDEFTREYYAQVSESFAKRSLRPPYPRERVDAMVRHLGRTARVQLLLARDPTGRPVATGIFPGLSGGTAFFWMGASRRDAQHSLPNEALMWAALRRWRDDGACRFDFGGGGTYKAKYGGTQIAVPWLRASRFGFVEAGRGALGRAVRRRQRVRS